MKKTLLIASLFAISLAACGQKEEAPAVAPVEETTTTAMETTTTAGETTTTAADATTTTVGGEVTTTTAQ